LGDYIVIVNAYTGKVLSHENVMVYVSGKGKVYATNPMICDITDETLPNMNTKSKLSGKFINIINDDTDGASEASGVYNYKPEDTHFDEVGMYYYMNKIHDYFSKLGFKGLDRQLNATVHYGTDYDNAYFSPWGMEFCFGDGKRLNNLAREAGIAYHEYTHAVTGNICSLAYKNESGAMNEGWSDYFACSLTDDPKIGEWAMAKMNRPWMRNLAEFKKYPDDIQGEVHADGKIWGSICWSIRTALGAEIADRIIHKGRYYVTNYNAKFVEGMDGILEADEALYNSKHKETLLKIFAKHGLKPVKSKVEEKKLNINMEK
jgi:Zn-dependent metalloprotease